MQTLLRHLPLILAFCTSNAFAQVACPHPPAFSALQKQLPSLTTQQAATALQNYVTHHTSPEVCELIEVENLLRSKEIELITLHSGATQLQPDNVYRCNVFTPKTAQCQSPLEDGTAHPLQTNLQFKPRLTPTMPLHLKTALANAKLLGIYHTTLAAALDGKAAKRLPTSETVNWQARPNSIIIAIYRTPGPWQYRKAVWYFQ